MKLGCIGDDFTGSSDLANTLAKGGMRVVQYSGIPADHAAEEVEAGVVSLKTRSIAREDAVAQSMAAMEWLLSQGCRQIFFKYCSTFDSTPEGNIGPVIDALAAALGARKVIVCPAFPGTGRSIYQGHLFVKDRLLNESGMENHPLTPMTDSDIRRWLAPQTQHQVGHVAISSVFAGAGAIANALDAEDRLGARLIVVDAIRNEDLIAIGEAARDLPLITGGSGVALGLPANFGCSGDTPEWMGQRGPVIALSGSCSIATREQVQRHCAAHAHREIVAADVISGQLDPQETASWLVAQKGVPLVYSSAEPSVVEEMQVRFGAERVSSALEGFMAAVARHAVAMGATRVITAGGETSGAIVEGLALSELEVGPEIAPGVPALRAGPNLVVALKSGNFGGPDFFKDAATLLRGDI